MKNKFTLRIGQWITPPHLRKSLTSLKALAFLLVMVMSSNLMAATGTYTLVTKVGDLSAGDAVIIVNNAVAKAISGISTTSTKYGTLADVSAKNNAITLSNSSVEEFTISTGYNSTGFSFAGTSSISGYLYWTSGNSLNKETNQSAKSSWTITIDSQTGDATIKNNSDNTRVMRFNSDRFACYTSNTGTLVKIFKKSSTPTEPTAPSITTQPEGASYEKDATATALTIAASGNPTPTYQWYSNTTESTSGASLISGATNASYTPSTATIGTKYYYCVATNEKGSATSDIVAVTITAALPKITITADKIANFGSSYADRTWTDGDISGKCNSYRAGSAGAYLMQFNDNPYIYNTVAVPGFIKSIKIVKGGGSDRSWSVYCGTSALTSKEGGTQIGTSQTVSTSYTWIVPDDTEYTYFYITKGSSSTQISEFVITYEELAPTNEAVTFAAPEGGSLVIKNGATPIATGANIQDGTVLDVTFGMTPAEAYKDVAIKVTNTSTSEDVTEKVYDATKKQITMPRYAITVAVTSTKLYKISLTTAGEGEGTATMNDVTTDIYVDGETQIDLLASAVAPNEFTKWSATEKILINEENEAETYAYASGDGTITATFGISSLQPLGTPTLSDPTNITYTGVTLNWQELANAEAYNVELLLNDETVASDVIIGETTWTPAVTLQANTTYTYTVQGVGDGTTYAVENNPKAQSTFNTADYPAATLTLSENGVETPVNGKLNTPIDLPTASTQACDGKVFVGWSENAIEGEAASATLLDGTYTFTEPSVLAKTIYAVYAKEEKGTTTWNKVPTNYTDWIGNEFLIVYESEATKGYVMKQADAVTNYVEATIASGVIASKPTDAMSVIIEKFGTTDDYQLKVAGVTPASYLKGKSDNGLSFDASAQQTTISYDNTNGWLISNNSSWLRYNTTSGQTRFRFYKSTTYTGSSYKTIQFYKKTAGESTYSNYCTTCQAAIAVPTFSLAEGEYNEAKTLTLSAAEGDIYYTINEGAETKYTAAIALNNRGTYEISAYAKVDDRESETVTKTYTLDWPYTLDELAASDVVNGTTVQVTFENKEITNFYTNTQGKRYGIYVNVQKGGKDVEIYCNKTEHPNTWEVGGKVSSTQAISGTWTYYSDGSQWEFCPNNWENISYTAPAKITSLVIDGDVNNKNYTAGQKLDFTGLTVTGVYSDETEENVTADVEWTEVTLSENQETATAIATLNNAKTGNVAVSQTKTISGLTVGAKVELSKIEITTEASKKDFFVGRNFNHDGIVVTATYSNGSTSNVTNACDFSTPTLENKGQETVTITYSEGEGQDKEEVTTSYTINVKYMNLNDLVAEDIATNTSVKVSFSDVEITGFYTNKSEQRTGVYVNVKGKNEKDIELYSSTPSATLNDWQEGGLISSKGDYITGTWKYYDGGSVWEIDFGSSYAWSTNIEYTAPSIYPTGVALSETAATVKQSKSLDLEAIFTPANATILENLEWISDNAKVTVNPSQDKKSATITVASDATVGTATIAVKVDDKDGQKLSATCVITIEEFAVPRYGLYSGAISEGDYIFKADGESYFMNNTNNNGRLANVANENNPEIVNNVITTDEEAYVWQIAKSGDYWTIKNLATQTYVVSTGSGKASLSGSPSNNTEKWTITYDETKEVYTFENLGRSQASSDKDKKYLRNNNNSGWACYGSGTGNAITLYKAGFTPAAALTSIEIKGNLSITEYFQGKSVKYDGLTVEGTYSDASKKTITEGIAWSADPTSFTELGEQTVTITATVQTKTGEVSDDAELNVTVITPVPTDYELVENVNDLNDGATIILGATFGTDAAPIYAVNQGFDTKYLAAYRSNVEGSDLKYENKTMTTANASEITLKKVEGGWKMLGEDGKYINGASDLSQTDKVDEATVWTIVITEGNAEIASGSNIIYYNTSSPRFKTYTTAQTAIQIYRKPGPSEAEINDGEELNASTLASNADVVINEGGNLIVDASKTLGDIVVAVGGKVTISGTATLTVKNFVIKSSMGGGKSGQVIGVTESNFTITGSAYYDVVLGDNGNPEKWHAFAVPFKVDAINGVYDLEDNKLTNEVNYAIMDYHGDVRAQGKYGWKKFRGIMNPGVFYLMTVDGERTTYRMKMNGEFSASSTTITVNQYASDITTDAGWNGIANNQLSYSSVGVDVQVLNPTSYTFEPMTENSTNFTVGTPFFYQADNATTEITLDAANGSNPAYAPARVGAAEIKDVNVMLSNNNYTDHLYLSATDEATNEYQIGHDLVKMTMTSTPSVPQIFANAYGTKLCMADVPMTNEEATYILSLYAPETGEYTMSAGNAEGIEVYLMYNQTPIWNLSMSEYTVDLNKGNNQGYSLCIHRAPQVVTGNETVRQDENAVQKFIFEDNLYIIRDGKTFDATGKIVK